MALEDYFSIATANGVIRGVVHQPTAKGVDFAPILVIHGYFSANRVGPTRLYVQIARALCATGRMVFRADAIGVGESDGDFDEISFESELRDFRTVCEFIVRSFNAREIILVGHSMGANLALRIAHEDP